MKNYGISGKLIHSIWPQASIANADEFMQVILPALNRHELTSKTSLVLAITTACIETGQLKPVREYGDKAYFDGYKGKLGPQDATGFPMYAGRGYIQLTWAFNYEHFGKLIGLPLAEKPDLALEPAVAAEVLAAYLLENEVYKFAQQHDWYMCRKLVNGNGYDRLEDFSRVADTLLA